jgi:hypothetical protein
LIKISGYSREKEEPGVRGGLLPALFEGQIKMGFLISADIIGRAGPKLKSKNKK